MSERLLMLGAFLVAVFAIPYITTMLVSGRAETETEAISIPGTDKRVCIYKDGEYQIIDAEEYIVYALAGCVDTEWPDEMYCVMAVITRTSVYYQMEQTAGDGDGNLIEEGSLEEERYTEDELAEMYADDYDEIMRRVSTAVADTSGQVIMYQGSPIMPVYHEISIGNTVSASECYDVDLPYLQSVDSACDVEAPGFSDSEVYSGERLERLFADADMAYDYPDDIIEIVESTASGFVKWVNVCGHKVSGYRFAETLTLQSQNFYIEENQDNTYTIISIGKGSSVGLSLYGACYMAANGSTYLDILTTYYTDVTIDKE